MLWRQAVLRANITIAGALVVAFLAGTSVFASAHPDEENGSELRGVYSAHVGVGPDYALRISHDNDGRYAVGLYNLSNATGAPLFQGSQVTYVAGARILSFLLEDSDGMVHTVTAVFDANLDTFRGYIFDGLSGSGGTFVGCRREHFPRCIQQPWP